MKCLCIQLHPAFWISLGDVCEMLILSFLIGYLKLYYFFESSGTQSGSRSSDHLVSLK